MPDGPVKKKRSFRQRPWTREEVVEAIQAWFQTYGEAPRHRDWAPRSFEPERAARYRRLRTGSLRVPSAAMVVKLFGSWNAAIEAAGLPTRPQGGAPRPDTRTHCAAGHRLDEKNTIYRKDGRRMCRRCTKGWQKKSRERARQRRQDRARRPAGAPPGLILGPPSKEFNISESLRLRAEGLSNAEVGERLGISGRTVSTYVNDPDGSKAKARRESYRRPCPRCGRLMTGSEGRGKRAPRLCGKCSPLAQAATKFWTRERVIEAIQRYAAEHGDAPTSTEWRRADRERGYPAISQVYNRQGKGGVPFASWADAIEAAGFPRPREGVWRRGVR